MNESEKTLRDEQPTPGAADAPGADAPAPEQESRPTAPPHGEAGANGSAHDQSDADALQGDVDQLVAVAQKRDEYLALAQRTQADFENYRKRVAREARAAAERGTIALAKELLPALDNLDRAIDHADDGDPLLEGVKLVRSELAAGLARAGIESFSPVGEQFDPSLHEAVATAPAPADGPASGAVLEVYQAGYRLGETVIRAARVVVAA
jgi:molecular chaperone GrpE